VTEKLGVLRRAYAKRLPAKIKELHAAAGPFEKGRPANETGAGKALRDIRDLAHKLAGSAATYGYGALGETARQLELYCEPFIERGCIPNPEESWMIRNFLANMESLAVPATAVEGDLPIDTLLTKDAANHKRRPSNHVVLVEDDDAFATFLYSTLPDYGFAVTVLGDPAKLKANIKKKPPAAILMDIAFPGDKEAGVKMIRELRGEGLITCPVVFLTVRDDFEARLIAVRAGYDAFVVKPVEVGNLANILKRLTSERDTNPYRVLIIDDDKGTADYYAAVLEEFEFKVRTVNDSKAAFVMIDEFEPDLILLDVMMPRYDGFELAAIIRQMENYIHTPIVFMTADKSHQRRVLAMRSGGDDFVTKPINVNFLITTVRSRVERGRLQKTLNIQLKVSEDRLRRSQIFANIGTWDWNIKTGELYWSERMAPLFGYRPEAIETSYDNFIAIIHPDDRQKVTAAISACVEEGADYNIEHRVVWPDGTVRWLHESGDVIRDTENQPLRMLGAVRDISLRKEADAALRAAKNEAEKANKAKSKFLSSMSHELRTPMNAILGFGQMMQYNPNEALTDTQNDCVNQIIKGGAHLLELINEVLDLAKIEAGKADLCMEEIGTGKIVDECISMVVTMAEQNKITINGPAPGLDDYMVRADSMRLKQVLLNLLSNAVKYNRRGGDVIIFHSATPGGLLRISVKDTGAGIAVEKQNQLFQPFSRLGAETTEIEGTGIGLTVTRQLMKLMGGRVGFDSLEGRGSTFWIELPLSEKSAEDAPLSDGPAENSGGKKIAGLSATVLYVEDNPANVQLIETLADRIDGFELICAGNAEDGLGLAESKVPDVILMDINLPGMSGIEALKRLRQNGKTENIPVIALTATATKKDIEKGMEAGFDEYLTKPFQVEAITAALERVLKIPQERGT
jgi:PAS domain S-box-containing protein